MKKNTIISATDSLPGRVVPMPVTQKHFVTGNPLIEPFPRHLEKAIFGMGCFWGIERKFWQIHGIYSTAVGYSGGFTPNPNYDEICTGLTGHTEVVLVVFDPETVSYQDLLKFFWENHNPTQGMQQGNDIGTQYRSAIYTFTQVQQAHALKSRSHFQKRLIQARFSTITTEIKPASAFYYAEDYHQAYLAKNPDGYCGVGGLGVCYD